MQYIIPHGHVASILEKGDLPAKILTLRVPQRRFCLYVYPVYLFLFAVDRNSFCLQQE